MLNIGKRTVHRHGGVRPELHFDVRKGIGVNVDNERWYDSMALVRERANYTDRAAAAGRRSKCQPLRIEGCHVVSATDPHGR
jgi:hypothetical protein